MSRDEGRKGRRLSEDDSKLWHGVTKSIAPLRKRAARGNLKGDDASPEVAAKPLPRKMISTPAVAPAKPKPPSPPALTPIDRKTKSRIQNWREDE